MPAIVNNSCLTPQPPFLATEHLGADASDIGLWFVAFPVGFMAGSFISGRIGANRSIEFMTILGGVIGVANGALLTGWLYFGGVSMGLQNIPGMWSAALAAVIPKIRGIATPAAKIQRFRIGFQL